MLRVDVTFDKAKFRECVQKVYSKIYDLKLCKCRHRVEVE